MSCKPPICPLLHRRWMVFVITFFRVGLNIFPQIASVDRLWSIIYWAKSVVAFSDTQEVGMEEWKFQHSTHTLLVVSTSVAKGKGDNGYHGYSIVLWGVPGCSRIYTAFPFLLPPSLQNSWLVCAFPLLFPSMVSFMCCPHQSGLQKWGQQRFWTLPCHCFSREKKCHVYLSLAKEF